MLIESALPRYSKFLKQRKSLAQKIGIELVTCFCNLETYLNLEFATGKPASDKGCQSDEGDSQYSIGDGDAPFRAAGDLGSDDDEAIGISFINHDHSSSRHTLDGGGFNRLTDRNSPHSPLKMVEVSAISKGDLNDS